MKRLLLVSACAWMVGCWTSVCEERLGECPADAMLGPADASVVVSDSGWDGGVATDAAARDASFPPDSSISPDAGTPVLWFVTSDHYWGYQVRGLAWADDECARELTDHGVTLPHARALLSDSTTDARDRLPATGIVRNVKGQVLAESPKRLFPMPGYESAGLQANLDLSGVPHSGVNENEGFWWASDKYGIKESLQDTHFCNDWSASSASSDGARQIDLLRPFSPETWGYVYCGWGNPGRLICVGW